MPRGYLIDLVTTAAKDEAMLKKVHSYRTKKNSNGILTGFLYYTCKSSDVRTRESARKLFLLTILFILVVLKMY